MYENLQIFVFKGGGGVLTPPFEIFSRVVSVNLITRQSYTLIILINMQCVQYVFYCLHCNYKNIGYQNKVNKPLIDPKNSIELGRCPPPPPPPFLILYFQHYSFINITQHKNPPPPGP